MTSNPQQPNSSIQASITPAQTLGQTQSPPGRADNLSPAATVPAAGRSTYAAATKNPSAPNASDSTNTNMAVAPPVQVGGPKSESPVNGKNPTIPVVPNVSAGPTIVNGSNALNTSTQNDHKRSPSVNINPAVAPGGYNSNGGAAPSSIQFGDIKPGSSPAVPSAATLAQPALNSSSLNQRSISPQPSPSPIPQPPISGGRPPSTYQQGNGMNFGSFQGDPNDPNVSLITCLIILDKVCLISGFYSECGRCPTISWPREWQAYTSDAILPSPRMERPTCLHMAGVVEEERITHPVEEEEEPSAETMLIS